MGYCGDLSEFKNAPTVTAARLGQSISNSGPRTEQLRLPHAWWDVTGTHL